MTMVKNCGCVYKEGYLTNGCTLHGENVVEVPSTDGTVLLMRQKEVKKLGRPTLNFRGNRTTVMVRWDTKEEIDKRLMRLPNGGCETHENFLRRLLGLETRMFPTGRRKFDG